MAYNVDWQSSDPDQGIAGKSTIVLPDGTIDTTSTSLALTGKRVSNYGEIQQENFIRLMENFASNTAPNNPTIGQLWFDNTLNQLKFYSNEGSWKAVGGSSSSATPPTTSDASPGDVWVDQQTATSYVFRELPIEPGNNDDTPYYYTDAEGAWQQTWPTPISVAGWREYNTFADRINRVIGVPSTSFGEDPASKGYGFNEDGEPNVFEVDVDPAINQYGWGQTDTLRIFVDINNDTVGYRPFDNNQWTILLSRLRKALMHCKLSSLGKVPTTGFIRDGHGFNAEMEALANSSQIPFIYQGNWDGYGIASKIVDYTNLEKAVTALEANRFNMEAASTELSTLVSEVRATPWMSTVTHTITVTFPSEEEAKIYFNTGGYIRFNPSITGGSGSLNTSWQDFLANNISGMSFDFQGVRRNGTYIIAPQQGASFGFYSLTSTFATAVSIRRDDPTLYSIIDGGFTLEVRKVVGTDFKIEFRISFVEGTDGVNSVNGTLTSPAVGYKANNVNVNSPVIAFPTAVSTAIA